MSGDCLPIVVKEPGDAPLVIVESVAPVVIVEQVAAPLVVVEQSCAPVVVAEAAAPLVIVEQSGGPVIVVESVTAPLVIVEQSCGGQPFRIQDEGLGLAARGRLNFVGAGVTATDDPGNDRTNVAIPGGQYLHHVQTTPAASVTVTHGFGRRPLVQVLLAGELVDTDIEHVSADEVSFVFPSPLAFDAVLTA